MQPPADHKGGTANTGTQARQLRGDTEKTGSGENTVPVTRAGGSEGNGRYREWAAAKRPLQIAVTNS